MLEPEFQEKHEAICKAERKKGHKELVKKLADVSKKEEKIGKKLQKQAGVKGMAFSFARGHRHSVH